MGWRARQHVTGGPEFASLLLDAGAVFAYAKDEPAVRGWLLRARRAGIEPRISWVTVAEVYREAASGSREQWVLSRLDAEELTLDDCYGAGRLMARTATGGKTVDALVAATALRLPRPVAVLTTDVADLERLLEGHRQVLVARV